MIFMEFQMCHRCRFVSVMVKWWQLGYILVYCNSYRSVNIHVYTHGAPPSTAALDEIQYTNIYPYCIL
jgi:hypothetical protein